MNATTTTTTLPPLELISIWATFNAAVRSVGTAVTLAFVGIYLHQRGFVVGDGTRTLALIAQQVTVPLFLFTKIIYCNQDWSDDPCPDVTQSLEDVWMLLFWPMVVVGSGIAVGWTVAKVCQTPPSQVRSVLAACGFANSSGLPITLLTVVHANFPKTHDLGRIDPTLFLSVYLLLYPVLQWGVGGWLLAPEDEEHETKPVGGKKNDDIVVTRNGEWDPVEDEEEKLDEARPLRSTRYIRRQYTSESIRHNLLHNVMNNQEAQAAYLTHRHGLSSSDEGMYMSELDLLSLAQHWDDGDRDADDTTNAMDTSCNSAQSQKELRFQGAQHPTYQTDLGFAHVPPPIDVPMSPGILLSRAHSEREELIKSVPTDSHRYDANTLWEALKNILRRCFQPPVVGALAGITCAAIPALRGIFVDLENRASRAPLEWIFDGLYSVGLAAVPMNMMILGCNLSASRIMNAKAINVVGGSSSLLPWKTMVGIVVGKLIILPIFGITLAWGLREYFWHVPDEIDGAFYLVLMIVFLTPTANNVMVMVELSGSGAKEGIAAVIALQYLVAPLILSLTMTVAVTVASLEPRGRT